ncbi:MAG: protease Lon-related BREX system protein BrxL [Oscillospiraceae bacterium]|nr:protease Lon-related BREX system protein BrxL [Oscillospiraceae bacterium]
MEDFDTSFSVREIIKDKLRQNFDGKIVRKDLTKKIKEGANVPTYVLEFLLGQYCSSDDDEIVAQGVENVKRILADNYVRPDESEKVLSKLRQRGAMTIIDQVTVELNLRYDYYEARFSNLGLGGVPISEEYPEKFDRLLCGGIWCIIQLEYNSDSLEEESQIGFNGKPKSKSKNGRNSLISIRKLTPIQMPHVDIEDLKQGRKAFTKDEWIDVLLRSIGMEPEELTYREKWLLLLRMIPLVENNFNLCELGPRSTGKSHLYKEISPNSILVSGGQTTVANLFYNMGKHTMGLVGLWDCVAFDEVAGIRFKDKDGIQIMKDYMASGSFARGKEEKAANASMVFVGNINQSVDVLLKTSSLFDPFPPEMGTDTAFLDRMHCYIPGWEIPKLRPEHFTDDYGFITDYLAEFLRELRKEQYGDALDRFYRLGKNLNQRDTIAVRKMVGGLVKLVYPDGVFEKEDLEEILQIALEMRRRVKEQLKKLGGMEFYDVNFSYIDNESFEEHYVSVPEQGGGKLIPEGMCNPGQVYTVSRGKSGMIGVFRLESQMLPGNGKFERTGIGSDRDAREATNTAFNFLKANGNRISGSISTTTRDYIINYQDLQGIGMTGKLALPSLIALCSIALGKPVLSSTAILGEISISGTIIKVDELANALQVCLDSGAKRVLLPMTAAAELGTVPADLIGCFNLIFYSSAEDAVFKALGVE